MNLTQDEFEAWKAHPVTRLIMEKLQLHAKEAEAMWMRESWVSGKADPLLLADLRARSKILTEIVNLEYEDI